MILHHWTLNVKKFKDSWFRYHQSRHKFEKEGVWFTDTLMGGPDFIRSGMQLVTVDILEFKIITYEEKNEGSGYRAFSIPTDISNWYALKFPKVFSDLGLYKISG